MLRGVVLLKILLRGCEAHRVEELCGLFRVEHLRETSYTRTSINIFVANPAAEILGQRCAVLDVPLKAAVLVKFKEIRKLGPVLWVGRVFRIGKKHGVNKFDRSDLLPHV